VALQCWHSLCIYSNHRLEKIRFLKSLLYTMATIIAVAQTDWAHERLVWRSKPTTTIFLSFKFYHQFSLSNTNPRPRNPCIHLPYLQKIQNPSIRLGRLCCYFGFDFGFDFFPYALAFNRRCLSEGVNRRLVSSSSKWKIGRR
jgi:hypothetical protein